MYLEEFKNANKFTQSLGLPGVVFDEKNVSPSLINDEFMLGLSGVIKFDNMYELSAKCNLASEYVRREIESIMGCNAYITIGYVSIGTESWFLMSEDKVLELIKGGEKSLIPQKYKHHCWITLESLEVLDISIGATIAMVQSLPMDRAGVMHGYSDELGADIRYHPILTGDNFYRKYDAMYELMIEPYIADLSLNKEFSRFEKA